MFTKMRISVHGIIALIATALCVACNNQTTPITPEEPKPENLEFKFESAISTHTSLSVDIQPEDKEMEYIVFCSEVKHFTFNNIDTRDELLEDDFLYFSEYAERYEMGMRDFLTQAGWLTKGDKSGYKAINLYPDTEYVIYCYGVEFEGDYYEATTPVNYTTIKTTAPAMLDVEFEITSAVDGNKASITIDPKEYNGLYYSYIVIDSDKYYLPEGSEFNAEYLEMYRNRAYDEFNEIINNEGLAASRFCHKGKVTIDTRLEPNREFMVVSFAVSNDKVPLLCSTPSLHYFATSDVTQSNLTLDIKVTDITAYNAQLTVTPSNNEEAYACVFLAASQVPPYEDKYEQMTAIIEYYMPATFTGAISEELTPLMPSTEYVVLAFGIDNNLPTTDLYELRFTSSEAVESTTKITDIQIVKVFNTDEILAINSSYAKIFGEYECVAIVEAITNEPCDTLYFWWYEQWMRVEYSNEAFLEDLLMYAPANNPEVMPMYYSCNEDESFFFAGIAQDKDGNISDIYYGENFMLTKDMASPAEEFFELVTIK